jgi:hypothetical protein
MKRRIGSISLILITIWVATFPWKANGALDQYSSNCGEVRDLLQTSANTLFAATQGGGVYKSVNDGATWAKVSSFPEQYVWRLAGHPSNPLLIFAATTKGLLRSQDGGVSWTTLRFDDVSAVAVDPFNPNHILIGVRGAGIYASADSGGTFSSVNSGLDSLDVASIAFSPVSNDVVYAGLNSNAGGGWGGVFRSTNGGSAWNDWNNPNGAGAIGNKFVTALLVDGQGAIHVGTYNPGNNAGGLYKQTGAGGWILRQEVYGVETLVADRSTTGKYWAGTRFFGPWKTTNYGESWSQAVNPGVDFEVYSSVYSIITFSGSPQRAMIGLKGLGLYLTTNDGAAWNPSTAGLSADRVKSLAAYPLIAPNTHYMGLIGGGVARSTTGGASWIQFNTGLKVDNVENNLTVSHLGVSMTNGSNLYAATLGRGLFNWTGTEWRRVSETGIPNDAYTFHKPMGLVVDSNDDRMVYYSLFDFNEGIFKRGASGTWIRILAGYSSGAGASKIIQSPSNSLRLYALMFSELPYISENGGGSWTQVTASQRGFMGLTFYSVAEDPFDSAKVLASTNKGLFSSTNGGYDWTAMDSVTGLANTVLTGVVFSPTVNGRAWASDLSGGYYCSNDRGNTWSVVIDPLLGSPIVDLKMIDGALYLITDGSGVFKDPAPGCP